MEVKYQKKNYLILLYLTYKYFYKSNFYRYNGKL